MAEVITLTPTRGILYTEAVEAMEAELLANDQIPYVLRTKDMPIPDCRNYLVDEALKQPWWDYALLLDDDVVIPQGALKAMIDANVDVAVIDYPHHIQGTDEKGIKEMNFGVAVYQDFKPGDDIKGKDFVWAGLGCVLVKRHVLEDLPKPLFDSGYHTFDGQKRIETGMIEWKQTPSNTPMDKEIEGAGEDAHFYIAVKNAGYSMKMIQEFVAGHCRIEKFILRMQNGRYKRQHQIKVNKTIDKPLY